MLKQGSLIRKRYTRLLLCFLFGWLAYSVNLMTDSILGGSQLGELALTAVSIVTPLYSVVYFFAYALTPGAGVLYGRFLGAFDRESAYRIAGGSVLSSLAISALTALGLLAIREPFLAYYDCTGQLYDYAVAYYNWLIAFTLVTPVSMTFYYLNLADGDALCPVIGTLANIGVNISLSIILCRRFGIGGLGMATTLAALAEGLIRACHLLRRSSSVRFRWRWRWRDQWDAAKLSISRCTYFLFLAVVDVAVNKLILVSCGETMIPAYAVINLAFSLFETVGAAFDAGEGFLSVSLGERNNYGIRSVMRVISRAAVWICLALTAVIFFGASYIPALFGLETPAVIDAAVRAARIMAFSALPFGITYLGLDIYATLNKPGLSFLISILNNLLCPLSLAVPLSLAFGFIGLTVGMALSAYLVIGLFALIVCVRCGRAGFPLYLTDYGETVESFDLRVTPESVTVLRDKVSAALTEHGFAPRNIDLLLEALYARILEKNPGRTVCSECTLLFGADRVRILVRDNGVLFSFADEIGAAPSSDARVPGSLPEQTGEKSYTLTTSFNRNGFVFGRGNDAQARSNFT